VSAVFGEGHQFYTVLLAFIAVLALLVLAYWLIRQFGSGRRIGIGPHRRQRRIGIVETAALDTHRRVTLIRRDNVEHLLLVGGGADVVIEPRIVRAAQPLQEGARGDFAEAVQTPQAPMRSPKPPRAGRTEPDLPPDPPARRPRPVQPIQGRQDSTKSVAAPPLRPAWLERGIYSEDPACLAEEPTDEGASRETEKTVIPPSFAPQPVSGGRPQSVVPGASTEEAKVSAEMKRRLEAALSRPSKHDERRADTDTSKNETETHAPTLQPAHPEAGSR
jgi:flagellar biogenesis protein FliO